MSKKKNKSYLQGGKDRVEWRLSHVLVALAIGLVIGGILGYQTAEAPAPGVSASEGLEATGPTDSFGRSPSHEHYGHSHP